MEAVAETDDNLLHKFLEGETISPAELRAALLSAGDGVECGGGEELGGGGAGDGTAGGGEGGRAAGGLQGDV